jgi:hypothetical protein
VFASIVDQVILPTSTIKISKNTLDVKHSCGTEFGNKIPVLTGAILIPGIEIIENSF